MRFTVPVLTFCLAACPASAFPFIGGGERHAQNTYQTAHELVESIGIVAHLGLGLDTETNVKKGLQYTGIGLVRFDVSASAVTIARNLNSSIGTKFIALMNGGDSAYASDKAAIENDLSIFKAIEGPNEINSWEVSFGGINTGLCSMCSANYQAAQLIQTQMREDFPSSSLYSYTAYHSFITQYGINYVPVEADFYAAHIYPYQSNTGFYERMSIDLPKYALLAPTKPPVITEIGSFSIAKNGYSDLGASYNYMGRAVPETTQAKHILNAIFDASILGAKEIVMYELIDGSCDDAGTDAENHYGLFRCDMTPKPAALAIASVTNIFSDAETAKMVDIEYSFSGLPSSGHEKLYQKSNGTHILAIWNDQKLFENTTETDIVVDPVDATLTFTSAKKITIYDPLLGSSPTSVQSGTSFTISVPDHVILIKVESP